MEKLKYTSWVYDYRKHRIKVCKSAEAYREFSGFTYYIYAPSIDKAIKEIRIEFDKYGDFHFGITYLHKITHKTFDNPEPDKKWQQDYTMLEIGCDYAHLHDSGLETHESVLRDAKNTIDRLIDAGLLENRDA